VFWWVSPRVGLDCVDGPRLGSWWQEVLRWIGRSWWRYDPGHGLDRKRALGWDDPGLHDLGLAFKWGAALLEMGGDGLGRVQVHQWWLLRLSWNQGWCCGGWWTFRLFWNQGSCFGGWWTLQAIPRDGGVLLFVSLGLAKLSIPTCSGLPVKRAANVEQRGRQNAKWLAWLGCFGPGSCNLNTLLFQLKVQ